MDIVDFQVTGSRIGSHAHTVAVRGELDVYSAPEVKQELAAVDAGSHLLIDLAGVDFIDSAGLGVLAAGARRVRRAGGKVLLVLADQNIAKLLRITGLDRDFELRSPEDEPERELVGLSLLSSLAR